MSNNTQLDIVVAGTDSKTTPLGSLSSNVLDVDTNGKKMRLPMISPHQSELRKSKKVGIPLNVKHFQFNYKLSDTMNAQAFRNKSPDLVKQYKECFDQFPTMVGDFFLQFTQNRKFTNDYREIYHNLQYAAGATTISDFELQRIQPVEDFESQITTLRDKYPDKIISPTLDVGIENETLFSEKLQKIFDLGFKKFNIIYKSVYINTLNWIKLSNTLSKKPVWCNVVGVGTGSRYSDDERTSNLILPFIFGAHTASLGYIWALDNDNPKEQEPFNFNRDTLCFDLASDGTDIDTTRVESINLHAEELEEIQNRILANSFYSEYIPSKPRLTNVVNSSS